MIRDATRPFSPPHHDPDILCPRTEASHPQRKCPSAQEASRPLKTQASSTAEQSTGPHPAPFRTRLFGPQDVLALRSFLHKGCPRRRGATPISLWPSQRGMEWGKEEEREALKASVDEVATNVKLRDGTKGRIICFPASVGGKIGTKVRS